MCVFFDGSYDIYWAIQCSIFESYGNPILYADHIVDEQLPTVLFYGHYDVQPADPLDLWESGPFEPTIRDGYIFARGASDNKGMFYTHLKAVESYLKTSGTLPVNVKFIIEGEEEVGSECMFPFLEIITNCYPMMR